MSTSLFHSGILLSFLCSQTWFWLFIIYCVSWKSFFLGKSMTELKCFETRENRIQSLQAGTNWLVKSPFSISGRGGRQWHLIRMQSEWSQLMSGKYLTWGKYIINPLLQREPQCKTRSWTHCFLSGLKKFLECLPHSRKIYRTQQIVQCSKGKEVHFKQEEVQV